MAKDRNLTRCCGASSETDSGDAPCFVAQTFSDSGEPMLNEPAGTTTISGQSGQSRNTVPGFAAVTSFACCSSACAAVTVKIQADSNDAASNVRFRSGFICQLLMRCTRIAIVPERPKFLKPDHAHNPETARCFSLSMGTNGAVRTLIMG